MVLWVSAGLMWAGLGVSAAWGQAGAAEPVSRPDESHARAVHRLVEDWVRRGGVPGKRAQPIRAAEVIALRVTLRLDGLTLGMGTALRGNLAEVLSDPDGPAAGRAMDLVSLAEIATDRSLNDALQQVADRQLDARIRAARDASTPGAGQEISALELGAQVDVDVQIAYAPRRIVIAPDAPPEEAFGRFAPGYHGLLAVAPEGAAVEREPSLVWPATSLASNLPPDRQVIKLSVGAQLDPESAQQLGRPGGWAFYRFDALHIVRSRIDQPVMLLIRGGQEFPARFVDEKTVADISDRIGLHLFGRFIDQGRVRGGYQPARGVYQPELAEDREAALASYTLVRYAERKRLDGNNDRVFEGFEFVAREAINKIVGRLLSPDAEPQPVTAGFCLLTVLRSPDDTFDPAVRSRLTAMLTRLIDERGRLVPDPAEPGAVLPTASTAVVLSALVELHGHTGDAELAKQIALVFDNLWQKSGGRFNVNALPWVALAHVRGVPRLVEAGVIDAETVTQRSEDLKWMLDRIDEWQIVERPALGPGDVIGGIVIRPGPEGSPPNPTWQTAPLFSFLATVIRDPQIVPKGRHFGPLVTASATARFLGQLMMDKPNCFAVRSEAEAVGGIRLSLYDNRLDIGPSALTLLAMLEMRETFAWLTPVGETEDGGVADVDAGDELAE
ncbi:MAG: hypothetical protein AAF333_10365 [Planctomycetota bacterium]